MQENFEQTDKGFIVYKVFGHSYISPSAWKIEEGAIITEIVNNNPSCECACGVNFGSKDWIKTNVNCEKVVWKCLLAWESLATLCVPYSTDGKARCGQLLLMKVINL